MSQRTIPTLLMLWLLAGGGAAARTVAVGDVHGEIDGFESVLHAASLIDSDGRWSGGDATLVQTGDLTDRGTQVRAVMDRMRALEQQAPAAGGRVVALLGNHEISNLIHSFDERSTPAAVYWQIWAAFAGDDAAQRQKAAYRQWSRWRQRYPGCVKQENLAWIDSRDAWIEDHPLGFVEYIEALSPSGEYGSWLRGLGVVAEVDGGVFLHGGISPQLLDRGLRSVAAINEAAARALEQFDDDRQRLIDEQVTLPFSSLWELHCSLFVEMARLEQNGRPKALARRAELAEIDARLPGKQGWFPTEESGPLWYRGLATGDEAELAEAVAGILEAFGAERIVVGHTPQPGEIRARFGGRVYLIDTAMAYPELGGRAGALEVDGDRITAIYPDERVVLAGEPAAEDGREAKVGPQARARWRPSLAQGGFRLASTDGRGDVHPRRAARRGRQEMPDASPSGSPPPEPAAGEEALEAAPARQTWLGPDGEPLPFESVDELLEFLAKASVLKTRKIDTGITLPRKLVLERDGVRAHAIFHNIEVERRRERLRGNMVINFFRDHYANNVAAFELGRMLGMSNVPPVTIRRVGRSKGSVQLWIEDSMTEAERRQRAWSPPGGWRLTAKDMQVFDNLINNIDRNQGNILYDAKGQLWFIDHTRSFGRGKTLPTPERVKRCSRRLFRALRELDESEVRERLKPYLGVYEIRGLMARRGLLIELIEQRIAESHEKVVLFDYDDSSAAGTDEPDVPQAPPDA